jgi:soluble lytic murein transglycosylase-like protein
MKRTVWALILAIACAAVGTAAAAERSLSTSPNPQQYSEVAAFEGAGPYSYCHVTPAGIQQAATRPPRAFIDIVTDMAPQYNLDPRLVLSVMAVESAFFPHAVSPKGARGLMQLMPDTAARFGVKDPFDPHQNIKGGMKYLRWLLDYFSGNVRLALAGYNAGENAVERHGGIPPYAETESYVRKVLTLYDWSYADADTSDEPVSLWQAAPWMSATRRISRSPGCYAVDRGETVS